MSSGDYKTSATGWIVGVALVTVAFVFYYLIIYSQLDLSYKNSFWQGVVEADQTDKMPVRYEMKFPKNVADFNDSKIFITVTNQGAKETQVKLVLQGFVVVQTENGKIKNVANPDYTVVDSALFVPVDNENNSIESIDGYSNQILLSFDKLAAQETRTIEINTRVRRFLINHK